MDRKCYKCGLIFLDKQKTYWHYKNHPTHRPPESDTNNMNNSNLGKRKTSTEEETIIEEMLTNGIRWLGENQTTHFIKNKWREQHSLEQLMGLRATYTFLQQNKLNQHTKTVEEIKNHPATKNLNKRYETFFQKSMSLQRNSHPSELGDYKQLLHEDLQFCEWYQIILKDELSKLSAESQAHNTFGELLDELQLEQSSAVATSSALATFIKPTAPPADEPKEPNVGLLNWLFGGRN